MISTNLRNLRLQNRLTQEQLAFELNVSRQVIAKWEKGESTPDLAHSQALANFYKVTLDNLVNFEGEDEHTVMPPKGKHFFGVAKMGERGQIVIPKKAREIFNIKPGDTLIILGDEERGIGIMPENRVNDFLKLLKTPTMKEDE